MARAVARACCGAVAVFSRVAIRVETFGSVARLAALVTRHDSHTLVAQRASAKAIAHGGVPYAFAVRRQNGTLIAEGTAVHCVALA